VDDLRPWPHRWLHPVGGDPSVLRRRVVSSDGSGRPPAFVHATVPTLPHLLSLLATRTILGYKGISLGKDDLFGKRLHVILSWSVKAVLCWRMRMRALAPATCEPLLAPVTQTRIRDPERKRGVL
jgi:hypothetical protein